jgi:hypothetical protein
MIMEKRMPLKIDEMYAFIAKDPDGGEGLAAFLTNEGWQPMVGADMARVHLLKPIAEKLAKNTGQPIKLVKFTTRTEIETIE